MALLEVNNLHTQFFTRDGVVKAVDGVSFRVSSGETLGIVGESGCGKSVTALSLMRLIPQPPGRISQGSIIFDDRDLMKLSGREMASIRGNNIAMIFQDPMTSLNPVLTIGRQLTESLQVHRRMGRRQARERTIELLQLVNIAAAEDRLGDYPHQFSGGMRQRVMIAMALACEPKLIIADEPTTALDVTIQAQILELLNDLTRTLQTTLILITHDLGVVAGMTQRTNVMYAGRIIESSGTDELFANPKNPYTWGLLRSIPRLDASRKTKLVPIEGLPPDLLAVPPGCKFAPRCSYSRAICAAREPELVSVPDGPADHMTRCWGTQATTGGGWLIGTDWRADASNSDPLDESAQPVAVVKHT